MKPLLKLFISLLILLSFCLVSSQNVNQKLVECSIIDGKNERLDCYDSVVKSLVSPEAEVSDNWTIETEIDPLDDSTTIMISTEAIESDAEYRDDPVLAIGCAGSVNALFVFISWDDYLGSGELEVDYRVGTRNAQSRDWQISSDGQSLFYSFRDSANLPFVKYLAAADNGSFIVRVSPYNENPSTATFDISGLSDAMNVVLDHCGLE